MDQHKCDGCGVVINHHVCCDRCEARIRQMRATRLPITIYTFDIPGGDESLRGRRQVLAVVETWEAATEFAAVADTTLFADCGGETFICAEQCALVKIRPMVKQNRPTSH